MHPKERDPLYQAFLRDWDDIVQPDTEQDDPLDFFRGLIVAIGGTAFLVAAVTGIIVAAVR